MQDLSQAEYKPCPGEKGGKKTATLIPYILVWFKMSMA